MTELDQRAPMSFTRRVNLWLSKFSSRATAKAYSDDLGLPHDDRDWEPSSPSRRGRTRGTFRKGVAFFPWCAARGLDPLSTVGLEQLQQWLHATSQAGLAKATRAHMLTAVREFYTAMQRQGIISVNPAALVDTNAAGVTGLDEDDQGLDLDVAQTRQLLTLARTSSAARRGAQYRDRDLAVLLVLAVTGARASEVTGLDLADYRRANPSSKATLRLHGKGGRMRTAELDAHVADDVDAWIRTRAAMLDRRVPAQPGQVSSERQPLFCTRTGARLSPGYLGDIMQRLARQEGSPLAGIADQLHPHALRAAFVTSALDAGVPIEEVAAAVGHTHIATTLRYDRRRKRRKTGAFRAVSGLVAEDHSDEAEEPGQSSSVAARLAAHDAEQLPGQTAVPVPGYDPVEPAGPVEGWPGAHFR
ncbi:tyrosine-type recombinase/integrase [Actinopolyspora halophila]|uniref:tyrosine-type recombinase/integrase n=1 Tax=Actinopolyspora halophila TaxID=1850 RepID=UPI000368CC3D|nr:tyrosine-type recombinase/integrase [Actinopolyspora halophila]